MHARCHAAKDRIFIIQVKTRLKADEELAVRGIGFVRARHRHRAAQMRNAVKFSLEVRKLRTTLACARWIARLCHESVNHAVKDDAIVKTLPGECFDTLDMGRGVGWIHLNRDTAAGRKIQNQNIFKVWRNRCWRGRLRDGGRHSKGKNAG